MACKINYKPWNLFQGLLTIIPLSYFYFAFRVLCLIRQLHAEHACARYHRKNRAYHRYCPLKRRYQLRLKIVNTFFCDT